jgi:hypothetical protein
LCPKWRQSCFMYGTGLAVATWAVADGTTLLSP